MNKPDLTEILNEEIGYLVDTMKDSMEYIGRKYDLNDSQISDMERDFIARLAFAAIIGDDEKKPEKEPEKSEKPEQILQNICNTHRSCMGCMFARSDTSCRLDDKPYHWEV